MNKLLRKFTAVVLAASVALGGVSFGALDLSAWAAVSDGIQTALDIGQGNITITNETVSGYDSSGKEVTTVDPDGYITTGPTDQYTVTVSGTQDIRLATSIFQAKTARSELRTTTRAMSR